MKTWLCLNGQFLPANSACLSVLDQGFLFGYGLFETILVREGRPRFLTAHLQRLETGCAALGITLPRPVTEMGDLVDQTIKLNGVVDGALRITLSAGPAPGEAAGNLVIATRPLPYTPLDYVKGFRAGWSSFRRNEQSPLVKFKTLNYLENLLARREAREKGWDEALFLNTAGCVAEGTMSNVFLVKNDRVITPSSDQGLLPGIMRQAVLDVCRRLALQAEERPVSLDELLAASECFLTNSLMEIMPLVEIDRQPIGNGRPGDVTSQLKEALGVLEPDIRRLK